ncbi:MAG TPA: peptidylprolyl isomerase [Nitrososphaerales archaeon]|nr:peptidylprolyl isomerase [Nitrososphaerales archaeon]
MPHSRRRREQAQKRNRRLYVSLALVIILVAAATGAYLYVSSRATKTTTSASGCAVSNPVAGDLYACVVTKDGSGTGYMVFALFQSQTPKTVNNIVGLINQGFYNGLVWHRIVQGFVIQTGDPTTKDGGGVESEWGDTSSPQTVPLEIVQGLDNDYGYLGMARGSSNNSGSSQFFINMQDNPSLNGLYTVFGQVVSGMNVAVAISDLPVNPQCQSSGDLTCQPQSPLDAEIQQIYMLNVNSTSTT